MDFFLIFQSFCLQKDSTAVLLYGHFDATTCPYHVIRMRSFSAAPKTCVSPKTPSSYFLLTAIAMLPEELLDVVLECLAYDKDDIVEREQPDFHFNHATNAIRALSLVDRQLRRISLPFLFSYVLVLGVDELYRFRDQCFLSPHFAACIK